jgi:hypothetical protein
MGHPIAIGFEKDSRRVRWERRKYWFKPQRTQPRLWRNETNPIPKNKQQGAIGPANVTLPDAKDHPAKYQDIDPCRH